MGGISIWYLVDCRGQKEEEVLSLCKKHFSRAAAKDIFVLTYDRMRRYEGAWHMEKDFLFPSYVFLESDDETLLAEEFGRFCFYMVPKNDSKGVEIIPNSNKLICITRDTEIFLKSLYKNQYHMEMSHGVIRSGIPRIFSGPLRGKEQRISRIDRHRRLAKLTLPAEHNQTFGEEEMMLRYITVGLEIIQKSM